MVVSHSLGSSRALVGFETRIFEKPHPLATFLYEYAMSNSTIRIKLLC